MQLILFKRPEMQEEFSRLDCKLSAIVYWAAAFTGLTYNRPLVITSVYREDNSVHNYWRGIDLRTASFPRGYGRAIAEFINLHTVYDPERPERLCAIYGANDPRSKHWDHIHLQVCYNNKTQVKFFS